MVVAAQILARKDRSLDEQHPDVGVLCGVRDQGVHERDRLAQRERRWQLIGRRLAAGKRHGTGTAPEVAELPPAAMAVKVTVTVPESILPLAGRVIVGVKGLVAPQRERWGWP